MTESTSAISRINHLGVAVRTLWAKSEVDLQGSGLWKWLPLWLHMADTAAVAGRLWDEWVPSQTRRIIMGSEGAESSGRELLVLLAGLHDLGKATPAFQVQVPRLADVVREAGLTHPVELPDRWRLPHARASQVLLMRRLATAGWEGDDSGRLGAVVGGHHGVPSSDDEVLRAMTEQELLGQGAWCGAQDALLDWFLASHDLEALITDPARRPKVSATSQAILTGLVITADWIASNQWLFPLTEVGREPDPDPDRLERAWGLLGFASPWDAMDSGADATALLRARFDVPGDAEARPVQTEALEAARLMDIPGLMIVEAPMGDGKTEAALLAAEVLAARSGAAGVYVALPTQATSDAMFERVLRWVRMVPSAPSRSGQSVADEADVMLSDLDLRGVRLLHGKAQLNPVFRMLRAAVGAASGVEVDARPTGARRWEHGAPYLNWWFRSPKRGVLADFVVGTIDQALFISLQAKHVVLRHLAFSRKVVILDEIHAFDAYSNTYLLRALEWFGAYGISVVALSATLPELLRARLVAAYRSGRDGATGSVAKRRRGRERRTAQHRPTGRPVLDEIVTQPGSTSFVGYDLGGCRRREGIDSASRGVSVGVGFLPDDELSTLVDHVATALGLTSEGDGTWAGEPEGCVLVLCNTVARAREVGAALHVAGPGLSEKSDVVRVHHSRFVAGHRQRNDQELREELGPPRSEGERGRRPRARVVVATQVAEQSLDIDVDLLITDLAPMDLILQRMGRLHRHLRDAGHRPGRLREPRCLVRGVRRAVVGNIPVLDHGSVAVYGKAALLRAAALLDEVVMDSGAVNLPNDIGLLVQAAYAGTVPGPETWNTAIVMADNEELGRQRTQESDAEAFLMPKPGQLTNLNGLLDHHDGEAEREGNGRARVRDTEDTVEVLLVPRDSDGWFFVPNWFDDLLADEQIPTDTEPEPDVALAVARCAVRLPLEVTRGAKGEQLLTKLEENWFPGWQKRPELQGQLVLPLDGPGQEAEVAGWTFAYTKTNGLVVSRR